MVDRAMVKGNVHGVFSDGTCSRSVAICLPGRLEACSVCPDIDLWSAVRELTAEWWGFRTAL